MVQGKGKICRHCRLPATVGGGGGARDLHRGEESLLLAVHAATGEEHCADGQHVAAPIDAGVLKPTPAQLGIDVAALDWKGQPGNGEIEVAFPGSAAGEWAPGDWVLMRVSGDRDGRVLVFDRNEWDCFLDGAAKGEFNAAGPALS